MRHPYALHTGSGNSDFTLFSTAYHLSCLAKLNAKRVTELVFPRRVRPSRHRGCLDACPTAEYKLPKMHRRIFQIAYTREVMFTRQAVLKGPWLYREFGAGNENAKDALKSGGD